jgi:hypothetical protein
MFQPEPENSEVSISDDRFRKPVSPEPVESATGSLVRRLCQLQKLT